MPDPSQAEDRSGRPGHDRDPPSAARDDVAWNVLIVDDSEDDRGDTRRSLLLGSDRRYRFREAETGGAASGHLEWADCVVLDHFLPDVTAEEWLDEVRGRSELPPVPVLVLTGAVTRQAAAGVLRAGAMDYLGKSWITPEILTRSLENVVDRFRLRQSLDADRERLRLAADAAGFGTFEIEFGPDGRIGRVVASSELGRILDCGGSGEFTTGAFGLDGLPNSVLAGDRPAAAAAWRAALDPAGDGVYEAEYRLAGEGGDERRRSVLARGRATFRGRDAGRRAVRVNGVLLDVTERAEAQRALAEANAQLERRVRRRTSELRQRADQLARLTSELTLAEQRERRRLADVLHEDVQQLLVAARMHLGFAAPREGPRPGTPDANPLGEVHEILDEAVTVCRSLAVELSPPVLHQGGLTAGLQWLARRMKAKHRFDVTVSAADGSDPGREDLRLLLFQAVRELLFNAVKHSGVSAAEVAAAIEPASPEATAAGAADAGPSLRVTVSDAGVGFNPDEALIRDEGGFGLFSIRERLTTLGGRMEVESAPGQGARFVILVPLAKTDAADSFDPSEVVPIEAAVFDSGGPTRVLLVDDHRVVRASLRGLLDAEPDLTVVGEAGDGIDGVRAARELRPDVVLMDFTMPRLDGVEATRRIVAAQPDVRVIGLSMHTEADRADAMTAAGAAAYLTKSGSPDALLDTIRAIAHAPPTPTPGELEAPVPS